MSSSALPLHITASRLRTEIGFLADFGELGGPVYLHQLLRVHATRRADTVAEVLRLAEADAMAGQWVAGFLSFEAAAAFSLPVNAAASLPLAWFAVFAQADAVVWPPVSPPSLPVVVPGIDWERYQRDIQTILAHIAAGDSYQVNYTLQAGLAEVDPAELFLALHTAHRHPYAAWLHWDEGMVASFSPELLLHRHGEQLRTAPIKGTCARLADPQADAALGQALEHSQKDRAEHVMIVDMARNDLGKICQLGTVQVDHLFERRVLPTVQHLETQVTGIRLPGVDLAHTMAALFPAASVTGAPKRRTMEIIQALEGRPRGLYTGSVGMLCPGGEAIFNVAIRTVTWHKTGPGRVGLGGGVVADSDSTLEWAEIAAKGRFLHEQPPPFQLLETFLLDQHGCLTYLDQHLQRLEHSAKCLGFACPLPELAAALREQATAWYQEQPKARVVRLSLAMSGDFMIEQRPAPVLPRRLRVWLAPYRVDRGDRLLRHKTTRRQQFDQALATVRAAGAEEALFFNTVGRVTEGAIRAILVRYGQHWYAPPLADGLLASIWRAEEMVRLQAEERSLTLAELLTADTILMGNSVQGGATVACLHDATGNRLVEWPDDAG